MKRFYISIIALLISTSYVLAESSNTTKETIWQRFIPDYGRGQFAGSIGVVSVGAGWIYGGKEQFDTDISFGYVPSNAIIDGFVVGTIKSSYSPWNIPIAKSQFAVAPLSCGIFISYAMSGEFWIREPSKYNPPYYRFSTGVRGNIHLGQRLIYNINSTRVKSVISYYEFSSCDLNIISAISNSYLKPKDYLSLALGVMVRFK